VINVTTYDVLLNCYITVTTAIGSSARDRRIDIGHRFQHVPRTGAAGPINNLSFHCHDPKVSVRTSGVKCLKCNACCRGGKKRAIQHSLRSLDLDDRKKSE